MRKLLLTLAILLPLLAGLIWYGTAAPQPGPFVPTQSETEDLKFYQQPEPWFLEHLKAPPEVIDGQRLDPKFQYMLELQRPATKLLPYTAPIIFASTRGRAWMRGGIERQWILYTKVTAPMRSIEDRKLPGRDGAVPVRIYHPDTDGPLPVIVYAHGGGWVFASVAAMDRVVQLLANESKAIVISVDYRLAPEHPYPAASDDGEDAYLWATQHATEIGGDPSRIAVGGDSAGGYISINTIQRQLKAGKPVPKGLLLYYPGTGLPQKDRSYELFGLGYGLDASFIDFIIPRVFPGLTETDIDDLTDPLRSKSLKGFPPSIIATAGFDILRDSGKAFADRLDSEGARVSYKNYPSLCHSFLQFSAVVKDADTAATETAQAFGKLLRD